MKRAMRSSLILAAELVRHRVALIVTGGGLAAAKAAKDATSTIPILFSGIGLDLVENGFLASFNRPGGNATGVSQSYKELIPKRLELLKQMVPGVSKVAYLQNADSTGLGRSEEEQFETETHIASELGLVIYYAQEDNDIETAFASMALQQTEALLVASTPNFGRQRALIVALAARYALPAGYSRREFADAGGLMSYGPSITESWRQIGAYAGCTLVPRNNCSFPRPYWPACQCIKSSPGARSCRRSGIKSTAGTGSIPFRSSIHRSSV